MENLAGDHEDVPACSDEQVEDHRVDCEIHDRVCDLKQETADEEQRRLRVAVSSDAPDT